MINPACIALADYCHTLPDREAAAAAVRIVDMVVRGIAPDAFRPPRTLHADFIRGIPRISTPGACQRAASAVRSRALYIDDLGAVKHLADAACSAADAAASPQKYAPGSAGLYAGLCVGYAEQVIVVVRAVGGAGDYIAMLAAAVKDEVQS